MMLLKTLGKAQWDLGELNTMLTSTFPESIWFCRYQGRSFRSGAGCLLNLSSPQHHVIPQRLKDFLQQPQLCFTAELSWRQEGASLAERNRVAA